jgi:signal transduction histidine kinase
MPTLLRRNVACKRCATKPGRACSCQTELDNVSISSLTDETLIFGEGTPPEHFIFVLAGEILVHRHTSSPVKVSIGRAGRITGKTPYSRMKTWAAEGGASGPVWLLYIHQDSFKEMLSAIPSMIERIVFLLVDRNREFTKAEEQIAKLAALGKLAANIAHELNNPASAARSSVTAYFSQLSRSENLEYQIGSAPPIRRKAVGVQRLDRTISSNGRGLLLYRECFKPGITRLR